MSDQDMLLPLKPQASLVFPPSPYDPGGSRDFSLNPQIPTTDTTLIASNSNLTIRQQRELKKSRKFQAKRKESATVGSLVENNQMILQDKSNASSQTFPTIQLSKTLEADSITSIKAFSLYSMYKYSKASSKHY